MIAPISKRRQGYGRAAIKAFLHYISTHIKDIRLEFLRRNGNAPQNDAAREHGSAHDLDFRLMVKIDENNQPSIKLFETLGFVKKEEKANFFAEFELLFPGPISEEWTRRSLENNGTEYREMAYIPLKAEESEPAAQE
jgi:RimJ/RimL family protein N-acetyltransferase